MEFTIEFSLGKSPSLSPALLHSVTGGWINNNSGPLFKAQWDREEIITDALLLLLVGDGGSSSNNNNN
jgi:hypothetical protein